MAAKSSKSGGSDPYLNQLENTPDATPDPNPSKRTADAADARVPLVEFDPAEEAQAVLTARVQAAPSPVSRLTSDHYEAQAILEKDFMVPLESLNQKKGGVRAQGLLSPSGEVSKVVGFALGEKMVDGRFTGQDAVIMFVTKKLPLKFMAQSAQLPDHLDGIPTDVIEVGEFRAFSGFTARERPAKCGSSVGTSRLSGTIGALVQLDNGKLCILSNNHVLAASNLGKKGDTIIQPGGADGGVDPADMIARLERFLTIAFPGPNSVDCAAALTNFQNVSPSHHTFTIDPTPVAPQKFMAVRKEGRTTGLTLGQVFATNFTVDVGYDTNGDGVPDQTARFTNQVAIRSTEGNGFGGTRLFSDEGDSGSLIVEANSFQPVALLFAGDRVSGITTANPIAEVIDKLQILRFIASVE